MTEQELIINITKGYSKSSNFYNLVRKRAHIDMEWQHHWCDYYRDIKKEIIKNNDIVYIDRTLNKYAQKKHAVTIYNKQHKRVLFTRYSKVPKYRTYKQQIAITMNTVYDLLKYRLYLKNKPSPYKE